MRILVLSDLPAFVQGGAEIQAERLISAWLAAGHEIRCIGRRMGAGAVSIAGREVSVARIATVEAGGRYLKALTFLGSLATKLLQHRYWADVIYCRFLGEAAVTAALLKKLKLLSSPLVATPANVGGSGDVNHLQSVPGWRWIVHQLDRHVDVISLIAPAMDDEFRAAGFSGRNFCSIPNGIPVDDLRATVRTKRRWIFVGRLTPQKGLDVLMHALSTIEPPFDAPEILIVGDGPERMRLTDMAQRTPWRERIRFAGSLSNEAVRELLEESQLFVLPSRYEGMSNAALEAMERGLPVLLTQCGGVDRYLTREHGWLANPGDATSLRETIIEALAASPGRLSAMGKANRSLVLDKFDMSKVAGRYLALFDDLLSRRHRTT